MKVEDRYQKYILDAKKDLFMEDFNWSGIDNFKKAIIRCIKSIEKFLYPTSNTYSPDDIIISAQFDNISKPITIHIDGVSDSVIMILTDFSYEKRMFLNASHYMDPIIYKNLYYHIVNETIKNDPSLYTYKITNKDFNQYWSFIGRVNNFIDAFPPNHNTPKINDVFRKNFSKSLTDYEKKYILKKLFPLKTSAIFSSSEILLFGEDNEQEAISMKMLNPKVEIYDLS